MKVFAVVEKNNCEKQTNTLTAFTKKEGQKVNALSGILSYMNFEKKKDINELVLNVTVHLFPFNMDVSNPYIK